MGMKQKNKYIGAKPDKNQRYVSPVKPEIDTQEPEIETLEAEIEGYEKCILNEEEEEEKNENSHKNLLKYMENNEGKLLVSGKGKKTQANQYKNGYNKSILNEEEIIVKFEEETNENSYEKFLNYNDNGEGQMDGGEEKKKIQELARRYNSKAQNYYKVKRANDKIKYRVRVLAGDLIVTEDGKSKQHYLLGGYHNDEADAFIQSRIIFEDYLEQGIRSNTKPREGIQKIHFERTGQY